MVPGRRLKGIQRIIVENAFERGDQVLFLVAIDTVLDGNAIDERTHHPGRDSPYAVNMERDGCVGPGLHLQMHVQLDSRPAH